MLQHLLNQARSGDQSAKQAARAQLRAELERRLSPVVRHAIRSTSGERQHHDAPPTDVGRVAQAVVARLTAEQHVMETVRG